MSKEAEILKTGISYHGTLLPKIKQMKGSCISGVSVLQKLTFKLSDPISDYGQSYLFN